MEQEKIDLARKQLEEDKEKFEKMMNDSEKNVKRTIDEVKQAGIDKSKLMKQIEDLNIKINGKEGNIKRVEEELVQFKINKHFLDVLAIQANKKQYNPLGSTSQPTEKPEKGLEKKDTTFLTNVSPSKKKSIKKVEQTVEVKKQHVEIDLSDAYEDNDFNIYFDRKTLLEYMDFLEADNLFKIHLVDAVEIEKKKILEEREVKYAEVQTLIDEVTSSCEVLDKSRLNMLEKLNFLAHYLVGDQNDKKKKELDLSKLGKPKVPQKKKTLQQIML